MDNGMKLSEYFEKTQGIGILATTDASGQVNQAIYSRPHFPDDDDDCDESCSFIMSNRLSHDNVGHNPSASYLFIEKGEGYVGKRLSLTVIGEETDPEKIKTIRHRNIPTISEEEGKYLVQFHIEGVRSLIGNE
jgi:BRCT domain type II-containing protein